MSLAAVARRIATGAAVPAVVAAGRAVVPGRRASVLVAALSVPSVPFFSSPFFVVIPSTAAAALSGRRSLAAHVSGGAAMLAPTRALVIPVALSVTALSITVVFALASCGGKRVAKRLFLCQKNLCESERWNVPTKKVKN